MVVVFGGCCATGKDGLDTTANVTIAAIGMNNANTVNAMYLRVVGMRQATFIESVQNSKPDASGAGDDRRPNVLENRNNIVRQDRKSILTNKLGGNPEDEY